MIVDRDPGDETDELALIPVPLVQELVDALAELPWVRTNELIVRLTRLRTLD